MSPAPKNKIPHDEERFSRRSNPSSDVYKNYDWQPSASLHALKQRAEILAKIRHFFATRSVLEVETPLLCSSSVTDPHIQSCSVQVNKATYYLHTSPEYAMKRLLAAGSGPIFQIAKVFRDDEIGRLHNPEFTMLEWYRPGFNHHQLMDEMDDLLQTILQTPPAIRKTYAELFQTFLHINPHAATLEDFAACAKARNIHLATAMTDRDTWLHLLMTHCIEPQLGNEQPYFVYDFPTSQAALARLQPGSPPTAARFEVYFCGIELANGFHELKDAAEQRARFAANLQERKQLGLPEMSVDELFLAALAHGLPDCSGVALGIDRLIMLATRAKQISDVLSFDFSKS